MNPWSLLITADGSPTLVHPAHGEACHSRAGAWTEARERYAAACRVRARAGELARRGERVFRLLDVGTGLGLNLAAALEALAGTGVTLDAVSLELDTSVIVRTLALADANELHRASPAKLVRAHTPVLEALERAFAARSVDGGEVGASGRGSNLEGDGTPVPSGVFALPSGARHVAMGDGRLTLLLGDGRHTLPALDPAVHFDAIFLDAFSPGVDGALWEPAFLAELARRLAPGALLSTYSVSLSVRAGLALAGLAVGCGGRVGTKAAGTLASDRPFEATQALDPRTARRVARRAELLRTSSQRIEVESEPVSRPNSPSEG